MVRWARPALCSGCLKSRAKVQYKVWTRAVLSPRHERSCPPNTSGPVPQTRAGEGGHERARAGHERARAGHEWVKTGHEWVKMGHEWVETGHVGEDRSHG